MLRFSEVSEDQSRLHYRVAGRSDGPVLALSHGLMSCNAQWLVNEEVLGRNFKLVMIELWGHGGSPAPQDPAAYTVGRYVREFEAIRGAVGAAAWTLVGQSYSAGLMLQYALRHPESCRAVITTNSSSAFGAAEAKRAARPDKRNVPLMDPDVPLHELPFHPKHARRLPPHVKEPMVAKADLIPRRAITQSGNLLRDLTFRERLDTVPTPVMLANGVYEKPFQADVAYLESRYAGLRVVPMEGGHSVNIEASDEFHVAVTGFLEALEDGDRAPKVSRRADS